jgi:hypothetical protein
MRLYHPCTCFPIPPELRIKDEEDEEKGFKSSYAFSLWLPEEYQKDTPEPTIEDVSVIKFPETTVYVRVFGGFATQGEAGVGGTPLSHLPAS